VRFDHMGPQVEIEALRPSQRLLCVPHLIDSHPLADLPAGRKILVLDESTGTGATLRACLAALAAVGRRPDAVAALFHRRLRLRRLAFPENDAKAAVAPPGVAWPPIPAEAD